MQDGQLEVSLLNYVVQISYIPAKRCCALFILEAFAIMTIFNLFIVKLFVNVYVVQQDVPRPSFFVETSAFG